MRFRVHCTLPFGTTLHVTGSTPALSVWSAATAPACKWTSGDIWTLSIDPLHPRRAPTRFEFKFFSRGPSGDADWEPGENHAVVVPFGSSPDAIIHVNWGQGGETVVPIIATPDNAASPPPTPAGHAARSRLTDPLSIAVARVVGNGAVADGHAPNGVAAPFASDITITFRLKYALNEGERLYVVGSILELGSWNKMHSPRLEAVGRDSFEVQIRIPESHAKFEYKYFTRRADGSRRWEDGENRLACPAQFKSAIVSNGIIFDDRWEKIRLEFSIFLPSNDGEIMHITGDIPEIGAWFKPGPTRMALGPMQMLETDVRGRKWFLKVWVDPETQPFSYRYIFINEKSKHELWEREPNRRAEFDVKEPVVNSVRVMKDVNFVSKMKFDAVPTNMFIGPYPQSAEDVDTMAKAGVTGVFNVQTDEDFKHRAIQWDVIKRQYDKQGIKAVRFPIRDFDRDSLRDKLNGATHALDDMLKSGLKVYVHCTAGMGRAPACVVTYLCWVKKMNLVDAVAHVKKYRTVAVPNVAVIERALEDPY